MIQKPFNRIVLTGAAGRLGSVLRAPLRALATTLVLSDCRSLGNDSAEDSTLLPGEIFTACDLSDHAAVAQLLVGSDVIVHFGGASQEQNFEPILQSNLIGQFNVYDNALACGVKRVVLASSNHVTGFYRTGEIVDAHAPMRPDGLYAVSKAYGELLGRFYHDRHGIESVCLRIGTCIPLPKSPRCLSAWISHADLIELVHCAILAPEPGFAIVYGVSNNTNSYWGDDDAARIGYQARDSADAYADTIAQLRPNESAPVWHGGNITARDYRNPATFSPQRYTTSPLPPSTEK